MSRDENYDFLRNTHDLTLSDWGPYARELYGLSHVADRERGLRLDFFMVPGVLRRAFFPPETLRECGCSPWEAAPDLSYYMFRQQMEGRNRFYADTAYAQLADDLWLGRMEFVNRTDELRGCSLLLYTRLAPRRQTVPVLPEGARWFGALDYRELVYSYPRFDHNLVFNAGRRGEEQNFPGTVDSRCIGQPYYGRKAPCFGARKGDTVRYGFDAAPGDGRILLRIRVEKGETVSLAVRVAGAEHAVTAEGTGNFELLEIHCGALAGRVELALTSLADGPGFRSDGFVVMSGAGRVEDVHFAPLGRAVNPVASPGDLPDSTVFAGDGLKRTYIVWRSCQASTEREYWVGDLLKLLNYSNALRQPYYRHWGDNQGDEYCRDAYIIPVEVPARGGKVIYTLYGAGADAAAVNALLKSCDRSPGALEAAFAEARKKAVRFDGGAPGESFRFSQQLMAAALLTNINFPIQARGANIRHHVPDKYYNSLYSWDSGFIGLGLLELDKRRAVENLNVYVTEPDDEENAFVLHGTPLPVQAYLYAEIWNRHQDRAMLEFFYPRLRRFYDFIAGHIASSTFRTAGTGLLRSWDYFYNSGGWDDYPPQWYIHEHGCRAIAPVVTTAHAIRFARILAKAAETLGRAGDLPDYERDIAAFGAALQKYSYDPGEKIFSYVEHDENGGFRGIFRDPVSGRNFNLGMDGLTPLLAGICTVEQEEALFARLASSEAMWTPIGLSTVDRRAPYFRTDGYWNGCVWMPHQWFFWKSALDAGRGELARRIADTALKVWRNEVDQSFYCFEHFSIASGRGAGCCHFGGLSSPVLNWYGGYYAPGRLTGGFDLWIDRQEARPGGLAAEIELGGRPGGSSVLLYVADDDRPRRAAYCGAAAPCVRGLGNCWEITLPGRSRGLLAVAP